MKITVDRARCVAAGMCTLTAPETFDQDAEDGRVVLLTSTPLPEDEEAARQAAQVCPSGAITFAE
ncbi:ferredoxin [Amycolatopsis anabasis]|uniref:ferredoxin n=1 Tax=Amycolatopsis anabasis TaxID=1840409 RepID=UPI00131B2C86|nr:ferredoxin [Amycolatopsis anabasis]